REQRIGEEAEGDALEHFGTGGRRRPRGIATAESLFPTPLRPARHAKERRATAQFQPFDQGPWATMPGAPIFSKPWAPKKSRWPCVRSAVVRPVRERSK